MATGGPYPLPPSSAGITSLGQVMFDGVPATQSKTITIINNSDKPIYPFLEAENSRTDFYQGTATFDPYDPVNQEYRGYIGYTDSGTPYAGLPAHSKITVTVPLAFWDSGRLIVSADGADQFSTYTKTLTPTSSTTSNLTGSPDGAPFNFVTAESTATFLGSIGGKDNKVLTFTPSFNSFVDNKPSQANWRSPIQNQLQTNTPLFPDGQRFRVTGPGLAKDGVIVTVNSTDQTFVNLKDPGVLQKDPVQLYNFQAVKQNPQTMQDEAMNLPSLAPKQYVQPGVPLVLNTQNTTPTSTTTGLVLWYHDVRAQAPNNDAPFQLTEFTFRGTYYDKTLSPGTGFDWLMDGNTDHKDKKVYAGSIHDTDDYDISFVDTINMPIAMEATGVTIGNTNPVQTAPFGWVGSSQTLQQFQDALAKFGKTNPTGQNLNGLGNYFGGMGWPSYLMLQDGNVKMPAGQNVFLASPAVNGGTADIFLNVNFPTPPNPANTPSIHAPLFALNDGPIAGPGKFDIGGNDQSAGIGGDPAHKIIAGTPNLGLRTNPDDLDFLENSVKASPGWWDVTFDTINASTNKVETIHLGRVKSLLTDTSGKTIGVVMNQNLPASARTDKVYVFHLMPPANSPNLVLRTNEADKYLLNNYVKNNPSWWSITYTDGGKTYNLGTVKSLWTNKAGKILGVILQNPVPPGPTSNGVARFTLVKPDYATQTIAGLWYSWAKFYATNVVSNPPTGSVAGAITGGNVLKLAKPTPGLVPGMVVTANGLPPGDIILSISSDNQTIHLSEIATGNPTLFSFAKPSDSTIAGSSSSYPKLVNFTFGNAQQKTEALAFAQTVFTVMAGWSVSVKKDTLNPWNPLLVNIIGGNLNTDYIAYGNDDIRNILTNMSKSALRGVPDFTSPLYSNPALWYPDPSVPTLGVGFNAYNLDPFVWFVHDKLGLTAYAFSLDDDIGNVEAGGSTNIDVAVGGLAGLQNKSPYSDTAKFGVVTATATAAGTKTSKLNNLSNSQIYGQIANYRDDKHSIGTLVNGPGVPSGTTVQRYDVGDPKGGIPGPGNFVTLTAPVTSALPNSTYSFFGQLVYTATVLGTNQAPNTLILMDKDAYATLSKLGDATTIQNIQVTGEFIDPKGPANTITSITQSNGVTIVTLKNPLVANNYSQKGTYYAYTFGGPVQDALRDGGFEYHVVPTNPPVTGNYLHGEQIGHPEDAWMTDDWTFYDSITHPDNWWAGVAIAPDPGSRGKSPYAGPNQKAPQGVQVAFVQGDSGISQQLILAQGKYTLSFVAAQSALNRPGLSESIRVIVDGIGYGDPVQPKTTTFAPSGDYTFTVGSGEHWITLKGLASNDAAVLIDSVVLKAVPLTAARASAPPPAPALTLGTAVAHGANLHDTGSVLGAVVATVDYGDGTGVQKLVLSPSGTFVLDHAYTRPGTFTVTVAATGSSGKLASATFSLTAAAGTPLASGFGAARDAFVATLYRENLGSLPDPSILKSLSGRLAAGADPRNVAMSIWGSSQHQTLVKQGLVAPITLRQTYSGALLAARRAARSHQPPAGPLTLTVKK